MIPFARMESASSWRRSGWNAVRGWRGFGSTRSRAMRVITSAAGAAGAAAWGAVSGFGAVRLTRRDVRPLPRALRGLSCPLVILEDLLGQLDVTLRATRPDVIEE